MKMVDLNKDSDAEVGQLCIGQLTFQLILASNHSNRCSDLNGRWADSTWLMVWSMNLALKKL